MKKEGDVNVYVRYKRSSCSSQGCAWDPGKSIFDHLVGIQRFQSDSSDMIWSGNKKIHFQWSENVPKSSKTEVSKYGNSFNAGSNLRTSRFFSGGVVISIYFRVSEFSLENILWQLACYTESLFMMEVTDDVKCWRDQMFVSTRGNLNGEMFHFPRPLELLVNPWFWHTLGLCGQGRFSRNGYGSGAYSSRGMVNMVLVLFFTGMEEIMEFFFYGWVQSPRPPELNDDKELDMIDGEFRPVAVVWLAGTHALSDYMMKIFVTVHAAFYHTLELMTLISTTCEAGFMALINSEGESNGDITSGWKRYMRYSRDSDIYDVDLGYIMSLALLMMQVFYSQAKRVEVVVSA